MPVPALIYAVGAAALAAIESEVGHAAIGYVKEKALAEIESRKDEFIDESMKSIGLDLEGEGLTDEALTRAVNRQLEGSGVQLDSVLDKEKIKAGFERMAMQKLSEDLGLPPAGTAAEMKAAVQEMIVSEIKQQIQDGEGALIDAAKPDDDTVADIEAAEKSQGNVPQDMSDKGKSNRERQARWRQAHTKHWVER